MIKLDKICDLCYQGGIFNSLSLEDIKWSLRVCDRAIKPFFQLGFKLSPSPLVIARPGQAKLGCLRDDVHCSTDQTQEISQNEVY